ncbi:DUF397 domain-containing protein [Streptomyces sp. NPDC086783]|uniref:DUF397 domain-containing protein n=1 Tax=Streptomyces sp. NPDC086783 TaxID=3365758 RepID=UPI00382B1042
MTLGTSVETVAGLTWIRSSYSDSSNSSECVEIAATSAAVHVRDSKTPHGPRLALEPGAWTAFVAHVSGV